MTNAHSVEFATQVKVKRQGADTKVIAKVLAIGIECDMAMLAVEDEDFWRPRSASAKGGTVDEEPGALCLELGDLPALQDTVTVVGYPIGGETVSITQGVVSRVEVSGYAHGACDLLAVQIDAAINSGNSGGPALNDRGECVGIAFQSMKHDEAENIGWIIPTPVIKHFINDYSKNGHFTGFPSLGLSWQKLENPTMRLALGMEPRGSGGSRRNAPAPSTGVYLRSIATTSSVKDVLSAGDILLSFDGQQISCDGTVPFQGRKGERINFSYLISNKYVGDKVKIEVLRGALKDAKGGKDDAEGGSGRSKRQKLQEKETLVVTLGKFSRLVPVHTNEKPPSYLIVGGLVFAAVTIPYLKSEYGKDYDSPVQLLHKMCHGVSRSPDEQVVVLSQVLVTDITVGYEDIINTKLMSFNGESITNLRQLSNLVAESQSTFLRFELEDSRLVVLKAAEAMQATQEVLKTHCISQDRSEDLLQ